MMPRRTTFTLEENDFIREARAQEKPATWVMIGKELNRPPETCRLHWARVKGKPSYKDAIQLRQQGFRASEVARKLKMNAQTVNSWFRRANEHEARRLKYRERTCLTCRETFASESRGNRICPSCKNSANWREGDIASPYSFGSRR